LKKRRKRRRIKGRRNTEERMKWDALYLLQIQKVYCSAVLRQCMRNVKSQVKCTNLNSCPTLAVPLLLNEYR